MDGLIDLYLVLIVGRDSSSQSRNWRISDGTSTSSTISTSAVHQIVNKLKLQRHRNTTKANYYSVWKTFNQFFI